MKKQDGLKKKKADLVAERTRLAQLHERAINSANQAAMRVIQIDAQLALLDDLDKING